MTAAPLDVPVGGRGQVRGLDGLRAVAVLIVFLTHAVGDLVPGGFVGVTIFFVLSGFLITTLLVREHEAAGRIAFRNFYARRFLRLYPAMLLAVVGAAALAPVVGQPWSAFGRDASTALTYTFNFRAAFLPGEGGVLGHVWSLAVEEQYYLLWPPVLVLLLRRGSTCAVRATALLSAGLVLIKAGCVVAGVPAGTLYFLPIGHLDSMLLGSLLALLLESQDATRLRAALARPGSALLATAPLAAVALLSPGQREWLFLGGLSLLSACAAVIVGHLAVAPRSVLTHLLDAVPLVWLGRRSYGFYLFHQPVILGLEAAGLRYSVLLPLALVLTLAFVGLSFAFVEQPALRSKARFPPAQPTRSCP